MSTPENSPGLPRRHFLQIGSTLAGGLWMFGPKSTKAASPPVLPQEVQYKWLGLEAIVLIEDGQIDEAISHLEELLQTYPNDPEFLYGLAVAYAQQRDLDRAADYVQRAVDAGLPFSRFQAGPRALLGPLYTSDVYYRLAEKYGSELVHGPLVGAVTARSARFWIRSAEEVPFRVHLFRAANPTSSHAAAGRTRSARDFTGTAEVDGLQPNTRYRYRLVIDDREVDEEWSFLTFPRAGEAAEFSIGFGGCAGYTPKHERIWRTINRHDFPAFLLTGDNVYIDRPEHPEGQRYCYYRRQSRPEFRAFSASQSVFAIWDDHDFATDDSWGGARIEEPTWKVPVWEVFRNNWNNPYYGGGEKRPGCWFNFSIADVDFFMLDDRMYRTDPGEPSPTMLGPDQKQWLFEQLQASTGTFRCIVTSVPWAYGAKPGSLDPWQGYKEEREEIFSFLHEHRMEGVILLSGDRHRADVWEIERPQGYNLYEFQNAQLTNIHTHDRISEALYSYNDKNIFGKLLFDTTRSDPEVTYEIITIDDEIVHSFSLTHSQLSY